MLKLQNCSSNTPLILSGMIVLILSLSACQDDEMIVAIENPEEFFDALPEAVNHPSNNAFTPEKEELGRMLFWDPVLSGNQDVACVSCHHPNLGYADGLNVSQGVGGTGLGTNRAGGVAIARNAPTVLNTAFNGIDRAGNYDPQHAPMFWDNRANGLEEQALLPMLSAEEMRGNVISEGEIIGVVIERLNAIPAYKTMFEEAFGSDGISEERILAAIATFERSIIANNSRFDQYMRGNTNALNNHEIEGLNAFINVGCADCHSGPMLSDYEIHNIGVSDNPNQPNQGTGRFDFRTPTLRNLNVTAPYMHNGSLGTLEEVLEFYERANGRQNRNTNGGQLDREIRDLTLEDRQIDEIIAFLNTLNDNDFDKRIPASVPSGLPVGGNIR